MNPTLAVSKRFSSFMLLHVAAAILVAGIDLAHAGPGGGTFYANSPSGLQVTAFGVQNTGTPLRKFVDSLPGLTSANANNLGQYIPVANPDTLTYAGSDYYEIGLRDYTKKLHSDLPKATKLRGYYQKNAGTTGPTDQTSQYLGPLIIGSTGTPVRIKFVNELGVNGAGDLPIPVDTTAMGAGMGPDGMNSYTQNRATLHLHGGNTPWISDGTPHQWTVPAGDLTPYQKGVSAQDVPDMPATGPGELTFFYPNQQSARLMFYHDHAYGITRLNVYAGEAAGYLLHDQYERDILEATDVTGIFASLGMTPAAVLPNLGGIYEFGIPLIIQDKTFVPQNIATQDSLWLADKNGVPRNWGQPGDLWFPHVYEPNQDPYSLSGANPFGRWDYGPWFWPPVPIAADKSTLPEPSLTPEAFMDTPIVNGTAYPYLTVEPKAYRFRILNACNDRFLNLQLYIAEPLSISIMSGGSGYTSAPAVLFAGGGCTTPPAATTTVAGGAVTGVAVTSPGIGCTSAPAVSFSGGGGTGALAIAALGTEVKMVPANPNAGLPPNWPTDGRDGGVPDPATAGPAMIQIGTEGGFLPEPVVLQNTPVGYVFDRRNIVVLNVDKTTLYLGAAERADVIVDFSSVPPGSNVILYNDSPAPVPAGDPRQDYYTGKPDHSASGGAPTTLPGYGPNTRTIMQFRVAGTPAPAFNLANLQAVLPAVFKASQPVPIVPESAYGPAYGATYPDTYSTIQANSLTFTPTSPQAYPQALASVSVTAGGSGYATAPDVGFAGGGCIDIPTATATAVGGVVTKITLTSPGRGCTSAPTVTLTPVGGGAGAAAVVNLGPVTIPMQPKAIQELWDPYGRMNATLGVELPFTNNVIQTTIPLGYLDPVTEIVPDGQNQLWKITHNGVDTHPVHFHLYNVQVINRVGWDGAIRPPDPNELGWKETVRMNPLEDVVVALQPKSQTGLPFVVPESVRLPDPSMPAGAALTVTSPVNGNAITILNDLQRFGWEYVWHCHILGHEENDFMRSFVLLVPDAVPAAPLGLTVAMVPAVAPATIASSVKLTWIDTSNATPNQEIGFRIERRVGAGAYATIATVYSGVNTYTDNAVASNTTYGYRVFSFNAMGDSLPSSLASITTPTWSDPTGVTITAVPPSPWPAGTAIVFSAAGAPSSTVAYQYRFLLNGIEVQPLGPGSSWTLPSSTPAGVYTLGVEMQVGGSQTAVIVSNFLTYTLTGPVTLPGAPTAATAVPGDGQVVVSFTAPLSGGSAPINSYTVTSTPGGITNTLIGPFTPPLSITVPGLTNGVAYSFTVTATSAAGTGPASNPTNIVTPGLAPGMPLSVSATAGNAQATVSFSAPAFGGTTPIMSYTATSSPGAITGTINAPFTLPLSITVPGLTNGTPYTFTVTATNSGGTGPASSPASNIVTPAGLPGAPTSVGAAFGNRQAVVSFTAPPANGSAIVNYTATANPGGISASFSSSPITIGGLTNGATYAVTVTATNGVGTGPASSPAVNVTPATVPDAPVIGTATMGNGQASVTFSAPASDGGAAIIAYTALSYPGGIAASIPAPFTPPLWINVTGLTNGVVYTFTVTATNSAGVSAPSAQTGPITPYTIPGAPPAPVATTTQSTKATVTVAAPASNGGTPIIGYTVASTPPGGVDANAGTTALVHAITGLTDGTPYTFTVFATNSAGNGPVSPASNSVTPFKSVPEAPIIGTAIANSHQVSVFFAVPAYNGGSAITSYTATSNPGGLQVSGAASPLTVTGLNNLTPYTFTVTATNALGTGPASAVSNVVTPDNPPVDVAMSANVLIDVPPLGTPVGLPVGSLSTTDADAGDTFVYSLVAGAGGTDNASFRIVGAELQTNAVLDYTVKQAFAVRVRSRDQGGAGLWTEKSFTIRLAPAVVNDFDADGRSDIGCYFPPGGNWYEFRSTAGFWTTSFGFAGTVPVTGDFDGDGRGDIGCYDASGGNWYLMKSKEGFSQTAFGYAGTVPVTGDFDADGRDDFGVYDSRNGKWYIVKSAEGYWETTFGFSGTVPVVGDFDGDSRMDIGVYYPPGGNWYVSRSRDGYWETQFGYAGTIPVVGDFDADGRDDIGCYDPTLGNWYILSSTGGFWQTTFGYAGTQPVVGDFDGDGRSDIGCYYPAGGNWYVLKSTDGFWQAQFGYEGTIPLGGSIR